jgi:hypothetical protein
MYNSVRPLLLNFQFPLSTQVIFFSAEKPSRQWLRGVHESAAGKNTTAKEESTLAGTTSLLACRALSLLSPLVVEQI